MDENLTLDVGSNFASYKTISDVLKEVSGIDDFSKKLSELDFHVRALKEELRKIDAFRRELPNSMHLLKDAIERLKEEKEKEMGPAMEEFILFKSDGGGDVRGKMSNNLLEKKNWMSTVQLWSTPVQYENNFVIRNQDSVLNFTPRYQEGGGNGIESDFQGCNFKNRTGAFVPFKKSSGVTAPVPGLLSLSIPVADQVEYTDLTGKGNTNIVFGRTKLQQPQQEEQERKERRCWTADLHTRFVDALHQLGGAKTATPKQIREVMKVDGLTNDEVKSHLQKYRIHIRKLPSSSAGPSNYPWLARDQFGDFSKPMAANSGSPLDQVRPGRPDKVASSTGGDNIEDEEAEKSEKRGWKGRLQKHDEQRV